MNTLRINQKFTKIRQNKEKNNNQTTNATIESG